MQLSHLQAAPSLQQAQASLPSLEHVQATASLLQHLQITLAAWGAFLQPSHLQAAPSLQHTQALFPSLAHLHVATLSQQVQVALALPDENGHQVGHELQPAIQNARAIPSTHTINIFFISFSCFALCFFKIN